MDPLSVLRDFTMRNEVDKIVRVGNEYRFDSSYAFSCSMETAYRSKQGNLYTLETLVHLVKNLHIKHHDYIRSASLQKISAVTLIDRKPLLDYLHGKISNTDAIEFLAPPDNPNFPNLNASVDDFDLQNDNSTVANAYENINPLEMLKSIEKPLRDRESILECRHRDFHSVLMAATRRDEERQKLESQQRKDGLVAKNRIERGFGGDESGLGLDGTPKPKLHLKGSKIVVPIILVPSASQTLITIYNVKEFLEDGVYIPTDVKVKQMKGPRPDCVTVQKKFSRDRVVMAYEVRDKPSSLKAEDWDRVVAVFVLGKEWQFKDWPFKDHVEIFNKILGFYMRFEDDSVESAKIVKQWNVKIISISKNKRHQDRAAALDVWDRLEEFMRSRSRS